MATSWTAALRSTLSHQVLALVAVSILAAQAASLLVVLTLPPRPSPTVPISQVVDLTREALKLIGAAPPAKAEGLARSASNHRLTFTVLAKPPQALDDPYSERVRTLAAAGLGLPLDQVLIVQYGRAGPPPGPPQGLNRPFPSDPRYALLGLRTRNGDTVNSMIFPTGRRGLAVKMAHGWLVAHSASSAAGVWARQVSLTFALTLAALMAPALWLAGRIAARIRAFADGAERFGLNPNAPLLPEEGPYELKQAIRAFNRMQSRIRRLVSDRTMMMAAVSHDLRTPLARIRFRIADLDPAVRDAIGEDVQQMDGLISQILAFTRDALPAAERRRFDLSALGQSLVDELADAGADVRFDGPDRLPVDADLAAVRRILSNLLDNALKYAGHARLRMERRGELVISTVEDDGPGVPVVMHQAVFEPFLRLEPSRNRETGGVGLGLAIARNLARSHGGDVALDQSVACGARFVFSLPSVLPA